MGFLSSAERVVLAGAAEAMWPPPPMDITRWCEENIVFDARSPLPGAFDISLFPFLAEIHDVLSADHPCREVTIRGSAQWGKTVSIIQPTLGAWHESFPLDSLVVYPTQAAATEWVDNKWLPMRRQAPALRKIFGTGVYGGHTDTKLNQETILRDGSLKVASSGSPSDLTGTTRRLVILDDVSKYEMTEKGDPEELATSRASAFEDAKILRVSTPLIKGVCRITRSFDRSDQRFFHVPCPDCGHYAPLTWDNFRKTIDPENLAAAHFTCDACGVLITHDKKREIVSRGKWIAQNPKGDHPGFHLWRAYAPQRDWASLAYDYARVVGWSQIRVESREDAAKEKIEAETEQTFWNDVLGEPFEQATQGPDWEVLRDRTENRQEEETLPPGIVPATGVILTAGVDCQDDRVEVHVVAFLRNYQRVTVDYIVIPHPIGSETCRKSLKALLQKKWETQLGHSFELDCMAIDGGAYSEDVWSFARHFPAYRVIVVKGGRSPVAPIMQQMKYERKPSGKKYRGKQRGYMLNVSQMKADFYAWLKVEDLEARGFCGFARGLGDAFYRMLCAEVRVLSRDRAGVMTAAWKLVEPTRRNEALDTMLYAEGAARRMGWAHYTERQWDELAALRGIVGDRPQPDFFDEKLTALGRETAPQKKEPHSPKKSLKKKAPQRDDDWLSGRGEDWV